MSSRCFSHIPDWGRMLWPQQLLRHPDLHVSREMPAAQGFKKPERMCFNVESGDQHDSALGIPSASKSGLSPGQVPEGTGGPGQGDWEMYLVSWQTQSGGQGP